MYLSILSGLFLLRYAARPGIARQFYWCILVGLFAFSAFRFEVGCDWLGYLHNYRAGDSLSYPEAFAYREPLWWLIQVAFNQMELRYPWVNVLTSALFFVGVHALAKRQPDRLGFLVLLFPILIINMPMSGIRQAAAIGLVCLSLNAFVDRRPVRFAAWILLASTLHSSALVFLTLAPLVTGRFTSVRIAMAVVIAVPALLLMAQTDDAQIAIARYIESDIDAFGAAFRVAILALSGLFFLSVLQRTWSRNFPEDLALAQLGAWLMIGAVGLLPVSTVIADRFGYYLIPIQAVIFARIPFLPLRSAKLLAAAPYVGLLLVFGVWSMRSSLFAACYVPYQTWLFGFPENAAYGF